MLEFQRDFCGVWSGVVLVEYNSKTTRLLNFRFLVGANVND